MATAVQKITLSSSRDIPFNKLILSQANVRKIKAGISVEELAEDIARRGLLQSLNVRPVVGEDGQETGMFEIPAGGRRYQALALLVKQKRLAKTAPVPCIVREAGTDILAENDSLAENVQRVALHPLDQFRAFRDMRTKGMTEEAIAAAFFTTAQVVKQRLRLASVSPALLDIYAEDGMTLEMLMAFTVNPDHARQEKVWDAIRNSYTRQPWQIRQMLTETTVPATDKRACFVGLDVYEEAGGAMLRDLFEQDRGGWLQDVPLLDRLVAGKLQAAADEVATEGWKWITVDIDLPYGYSHGLRRLAGITLELPDEERAAREALRDEYDRLEHDHAEAEELPDEVDQRLGEIEQALDAFERRPAIYNPAEIPRAGVFISLDREGGLVIDRGYVRPEDEAPADGESDATDPDTGAAARDPAAPAGQRAVITIGGQPSEPEEDEDDDTIRPLPDRLVSELTAHRTLALRNAVANNPQVALTALLHRLVQDTFDHRGEGCLEASVRSIYLPVQEAALKDSASATDIDQRHEAWKADIPVADDDALWTWLVGLDDASRLALLAHCVSFGVNALYEKPNPYSGSGVSQHGLDHRLREADRLALATGLDMVEAGWRPTVDTYLGRVTKARIIEAVRDGVGEHAIQLIEHLKKAEMATEAARLLADSGWLPEPLRLVIDDGAEEPSDTHAVEDEALPDFLAGELDGAAEDAEATVPDHEQVAAE